MEVILHEMVHRTIYVNGQGAFNEGVATFVGQMGTRWFYERRGGEGVENLARDFRMPVVALGALLPWFFVAFFGFGSWATLRALGRRVPFVPVLALFAFASLWAAMGLLAKTGLVLATGEQEPPVNLTLLLEHPSRGGAPDTVNIREGDLNSFVSG